MLTGTFEGVSDWLVGQVQRPPTSPVVVVHMNVYNYYLLKRAVFSEALKQDCTFIFDRIGLKLGARILGLGLVSDVNGTDMFPLVMHRAAEQDLGVFFLGGTEVAIERAVANAQRQFPSLRIAGWSSEYFRPDAETRLAAEIRASGAQLLLVARGSLLHDDFILRCKRDFGVSVIWNVGGLFDFVSGLRPRAPMFMRQLRLEWLFRFWLEPRRMWHRTQSPLPGSSRMRYSSGYGSELRVTGRSRKLRPSFQAPSSPTLSLQTSTAGSG